MIFTTRTLSTLKFFGFGGITVKAASATREESMSSNPYCLDAIAGLRAVARVVCVKGVGNDEVERSGMKLAGHPNENYSPVDQLSSSERALVDASS